ncbi:Transducin/WD40 repeat-like superfamily protein [Rhynchospora pubera]|uniref:Transducin/WD40 repeat-like superfamily protein n=1 Tax=Rhynchospora pubera TaxID=906938 RepID=A0AAV8G3B5_9POAL|nr:Transducin/WD40 repeat-like superfamily protein [Rhynchospora pubera]KAJ4800128.1 Transducin/WD40 repeat-like superfamily protein [Rhynchospora pubera]
MAFVKKLVEKVEKVSISKKQIGGGTINSLLPEEVNPVLSFHYGIPTDSSVLAYDPVQQILAIATRNGQIKLFGRDNSQTLLQSLNVAPTIFLQFIHNQGILLNVNSQNQIEVWDIESRLLSHTHTFNNDITSFAVLQHSWYIYVGDCNGEVSVLKFDPTQKKLLNMPYQIPFSKSYGEGAREIPVTNILLQPMAESRRVLIVFLDGLLVLWDLQSSEVVLSTGKGAQLSSQNELKTVTSACWTCTHGSKVAIGYSSGDTYLWSIPVLSNENCSSEKRKSDASSAQNVPLLKLNLGFKLDKVPIVSLRWVSGDSKTNRLYVNGFCDDPLYHSFQVLILNEATEARTVKLVLPLTESCISVEHISLSSDKNKQKQNTLALLLKSGHLCLFNDLDIERYLVQSQSKSPPTLPSQTMVSVPSYNSGVTAAKLYTSNGSVSSIEDYSTLAKKYPQFLSTNAKERDSHVGCTSMGNLWKTKSLYITGHLDGTINFWDASCPLLLLIFSLKQQNGGTNASSTSPITSLYFDAAANVLISGDQTGQVRIITFKKDASENILSFLQAKPGENYIIRGLKLPGAIVCISRNSNSKHVAVGTDKGLVVLVHIEEASILYQKQMQGQVASGIISMQFEKFVLEGFEKNVLLVATEDSSILAIEEDTGIAISPNTVHTKNPSRALLMHVLEEGQGLLENQNVSIQNSFRETTSKNSLLLLCSENAIRIYSLSHAIQGIKKQVNKKRLDSNSCYASLIHSLSNGIGLLLVFTSGKIEIRSLPDLHVLKDASLRGFKFSRNPNSYTSLAGSSDGELIMVNGDQEISFFTTLSQKDSYRHLEYLSAVYRKDISLQEETSYTMNSPKEKKMGLFGKVMKDLKGSKVKNNDDNGTDYSNARDFEQLSLILEASNFPVVQERRKSSEKEEEVELSIDDIEIEDEQEVEESKEKNKAQQFTAFSKQKLGKGLQALKGKLKPKTDEKVNPGKVKVEEEPASSVDQIKAKYGYSTSNEMNAAKMAENKLRDNVRKLEDINVRSAEMANSAQTFSSMANELLKSMKSEKS